MEWSPNGHYLCVWDSPADCSVHIFNISGQLLQTFAPYDDFLGVKTVRWAPNSKVLAVATYDEQVWFLEHLTWKPVWISIHPAKIDIPTLVRGNSVKLLFLSFYSFSLSCHRSPCLWKQSYWWSKRQKSFGKRCLQRRSPTVRTPCLVSES